VGEINLIAPGRTIDPAGPFRLSLIVTGEVDAQSHSLPEVLRVTVTPELGAPSRLELRRETPVPDQIDLRPGEFRRIDYVGEVPPNLRGVVRIVARDTDAAAMVVQIASPAAPAQAVDIVDDPNRREEGRLTFHEPFFGVAGAGSDANAQFQLSFKLRLYEPADRESRRILDNMYFSYTQASFWDLTADSQPFLDTRYVPGFFYYIPATDWRVGGNPVGIASGYEHESNGQDGEDSRDIDTLFFRPYFAFGNPEEFHWTFSPKLYGYIDKEENPDIYRYRGFGDYRFTWGKDDDWQVAWTLRKGTKSDAGSLDLQATYPLHRLRPGLAGYLMGQFFTGYGETLLDYDQRESWSLRIGYALSR
jgi:outer membrane phospholipase A